jgi:hypothetical protein
MAVPKIVLVTPDGRGESRIPISWPGSSGEIINADSMQIYRTDIGTANPAAERRKFYHLIDIRLPTSPSTRPISSWPRKPLAPGKSPLLSAGRTVPAGPAAGLFPLPNRSGDPPLPPTGGGKG